MYQFKLYTREKVFKKVINPNIIKSDIHFTANINGGLGNLNIVLNSPITDESFVIGDIIEVSQFIEGGELKIYAGYISEINKIVRSFEEIELVCYGMNALFKKVIYEESLDYSPTISGDPYTLAETIVDYVNTKHNYFSISGDTVGTTVSYETQNSDTLSILSDIKNLAENYYFYVDKYNVRFSPIPSSPTHTFTLQKDIVELSVNTDESSMSNLLILEYGAGTKVYQDTASILAYGVRETYKQDTRIANIATADEYGANFLLNNKDPIEKITLKLRNREGGLIPIDSWGEIDGLGPIDIIGSKSFFSIQPGDTCKIRNIKKELYDNLIIVKVDYTDDICTISLNKYDDFISLIK